MVSGGAPVVNASYIFYKTYNQQGERPQLQPALPANQGFAAREAAQRRMAAGRGDSERNRARRALSRQPGHGAQSGRRARGGKPAGAAEGQGNLRRHAGRAASAFPLPASRAPFRGAGSGGG